MSLCALREQRLTAALQPDGYHPAVVRHCLKTYGKPAQDAAAQAQPASDEAESGAGNGVWSLDDAKVRAAAVRKRALGGWPALHKKRDQTGPKPIGTRPGHPRFTAPGTVSRRPWAATADWRQVLAHCVLGGVPWPRADNGTPPYPPRGENSHLAESPIAHLAGGRHPHWLTVPYSRSRGVAQCTGTPLR
jgi:hypothetical protein